MFSEKTCEILVKKYKKKDDDKEVGKSIGYVSFNLSDFINPKDGGITRKEKTFTIGRLEKSIWVTL